MKAPDFVRLQNDLLSLNDLTGRGSVVSEDEYQFGCTAVRSYLLQRFGGFSFEEAKVSGYAGLGLPKAWAAEDLGMTLSEVDDLYRMDGGIVSRVARLEGHGDTLSDALLRFRLLPPADRNDEGEPDPRDGRLWEASSDDDVRLVGYAVRFWALQNRAGLSALEAACYLHDEIPETLDEVARDFGADAGDMPEIFERSVLKVGEASRCRDVFLGHHAPLPPAAFPYALRTASTSRRAAENPSGDRRALQMIAADVACGMGMGPVVAEYAPFRLFEIEIQEEDGVKRCFVTDYLSDAPVDVLRSFLECAFNSDGFGLADIPDAARRWVLTESYRERVRPVVTRRNPGMRLADGRLSSSLSRLRRKGLIGNGSTVLPVWTSSKMTREYSESCAIVGVAPVPSELDDPSVPDCVLDYTAWLSWSRSAAAGLCEPPSPEDAAPEFPEDDEEKATKWLSEHGVRMYPSTDDGGQGTWRGERLPGEGLGAACHARPNRQERDHPPEGLRQGRRRHRR